MEPAQKDIDGVSGDEVVSVGRDPNAGIRPHDPRHVPSRTGSPAVPARPAQGRSAAPSIMTRPNARSRTVSNSAEQNREIHLYDGDGDLLLHADKRSDRVILLPWGDPRLASPDRDRIRIMWGQHLLADVVAGRYRTVVCAVNDVDNSHGMLGELLDSVPTSQWNVKTATAYSNMFHKSVADHAPHDHEPYILKFDLDRLLIMALLRPRDQEYFTLRDLAHGFETVTKMLAGRRERWPVASVSFLGAKTNRLVDDDGREPSFESVLRVMFDAGYRADVYPSTGMWELAPTGVFASYPFPKSLDVMREGGY
jgi:hypothetical protein